jgi:hypothetical protein
VTATVVSQLTMLPPILQHRLATPCLSPTLRQSVHSWRPAGKARCTQRAHGTGQIPRDITLDAPPSDLCISPSPALNDTVFALTRMAGDISGLRSPRTLEAFRIVQDGAKWSLTSLGTVTSTPTAAAARARSRAALSAETATEKAWLDVTCSSSSAFVLEPIGLSVVADGARASLLRPPPPADR